MSNEAEPSPDQTAPSYTNDPENTFPSTSQPIPKLLVLAISDIRKLDIFQMPNAENPLLLCRRQFVASFVLPHVVGSQRES
jgi:hypothetical protein